MKLYVEWDYREILTREELDERIVELLNDDDTFCDFLDYTYSSLEIFEMRHESRMSLLKEFSEWAMEHTADLADLCEVEIDFDTPLSKLHVVVVGG